MTYQIEQVNKKKYSVATAEIDDTPFSDSGELIPLIVEEEYTIYGDQLYNSPYLSEALIVIFECAIGSQSGNDYTITPELGDVGEITIYMTVWVDGIVVRKTTSTLVIKAKINSGTKSILLVGDSIINGGAHFEFAVLESVFDGITWSSIGTEETGGVYHEGHSGRTYDWLVNDAESPFTKNGSLDIAAYFTDNSLAVPDFIDLRMGVNTAFVDMDVGFDEADLIEWLGYLKELVDAFLAHDSSLQISVGLPTNCDNNGAWNSQYPDDQYQDEYIEIIQMMRDAIIPIYENGEYNSRVFVNYIPYSLSRDTGYSTINALHPIADGHTMMGDSLAASINRMLIDSAYGPELIANGDFDTDTDWIKGTGVTISGGKAIILDQASAVALQQNSVVEPGKTYNVIYTISNRTVGGVAIRVGFTFGTIREADGTYEEEVTAGAGASFIINAARPLNSMDIDVVSCKEVL